MKDILVNKRYRVDRRIGEGGFGLVYAGIDIETKEEVAIKLARIRDGPEALQYEADTYAELSGGVGIPRVFWFGPEGDFYVLVYELLGPSLEDLFNYCDRKFSLKTVLLIADQAIHRIKHIHNKGYLHCDIKPDNFLLGVGNKGNILYTIDFGLARNIDADEGHGIQDDRPLGGTAREIYASTKIAKVSRVSIVEQKYDQVRLCLAKIDDLGLAERWNAVGEDADLQSPDLQVQR
ncbi:hypothetical protein ED733_000655 [Metarhizium rileyi]|uniref:non-specific serine/threonine protein kinase n=1 Tax=Metarhizium rileyi (strain RCEF 4871) TaxID=1649241 RepID=A0A5C6G4X0_METRR|nr:hypothetical protein ED733_000655 [Metarhizium rileyi]